MFIRVVLLIVRHHHLMRSSKFLVALKKQITRQKLLFINACVCLLSVFVVVVVDC